MWYSDCPYLVPSKAPPGWTKDLNICTKVANALKDTKIHVQVQRSLNCTKTAKSPNPTSARENPPIVLTTVYTTLTTDTPRIQSFLIYNGGLDAHVCNSKSVHLYTKLCDAYPDKYLNSGVDKMKIEHWGQLETSFQSPAGITPVVIENVAYVGGFITSLISQSILDIKGVHFDTGGPRLYKNNIAKYLLYQTKGHYTFTPSGPAYPYPDDAQKILTAPVTTLVSVFTPVEIKNVHQQSSTK